MKVRNGFVSNSSSSSFIINMSDLTPLQVDQILNHELVASAAELPDFYSGDGGWDVEIVNGKIKGQTPMDNFNMHAFLEHIGVNLKKVDFDGENY